MTDELVKKATEELLSSIIKFHKLGLVMDEERCTEKDIFFSVPKSYGDVTSDDLKIEGKKIILEMVKAYVKLDGIEKKDGIDEILGDDVCKRLLDESLNELKFYAKVREDDIWDGNKADEAVKKVIDMMNESAEKLRGYEEL